MSRMSRALFAGRAAILVTWLAACGEGQSAVACRCPASTGGYVEIAVPQARQSDVDSVKTSGPGCSGDVEPYPGGFQARAQEGVCHVEVAFKSGLPTYTIDVTVTRPQCAGECCSVCGGLPGAFIAVPDS